MNWAQRLKRVFNIDVEVCSHCGGRVKVLACIEDQPVIDQILNHLDRKGTWLTPMSLIPDGTGPGSGQMPTVENLVATNGAQAMFSWTLPPDMQTQNDGNVDRIRARILDSNDVWIVDDRFDDSATAKTYTTPQGAITHNGAYVAQIMVEGLAPFNRSRNFATFVVEDAGVAGEAVNVDSHYHARDFRGPNSVGWRTGDRQDVSVDVNPYENTYVHVEQNGTVLQAYQAFDRPEEFNTPLAYDPALSGEWDVVIWNGAVKTTTQVYALGPLQQLPLVTNIRIEPDNLTPTFHWDLPTGNTVPFDEIAIGLFDDVTNARILSFGPGQDELFDVLPTTATSYKFSPGMLQEGGRYVVRVLLIDRNGSGNTINRSVTFFNFTPIMESGVGEIFLPTLDEGGIYNFDFDVAEAVPVTLDPEVAIGYIYEIGPGNPRFASVEFPFEGDGLYDLTVYDDTGSIVHTAQVAALSPFDLTQVDATGVSKFEVGSIEIGAGLDPLDTTAFMTTITFASSGRFTGTMTPVVQEVEEIESVFDTLLADIQQLVDEGRLSPLRSRLLEIKVNLVEKKFDKGKLRVACGISKLASKLVGLYVRRNKLDAPGGEQIRSHLDSIRELMGCGFVYVR